jgi:hypothetical protein
VADPSPDTTVQLSASEVATVRQALQLLLDSLSREEADQIDEIQALLARLPAA